MLVKILLSLINKHASKYLENFNKEQLKGSLLAGTIKMSKLKFKPRAFADVFPAITLINSFIDSIDIKLKLLSSEPTCVTISGV